MKKFAKDIANALWFDSSMIISPTSISPNIHSINVINVIVYV